MTLLRSWGEPPADNHTTEWWYGSSNAIRIGVMIIIMIIMMISIMTSIMIIMMITWFIMCIRPSVSICHSTVLGSTQI